MTAIESEAPESVDTRPPHLRKTLRRVDIVLLAISAIISIDTVAQIAATGGAQAFTWTVVIIITFMIPYAFVVSELGSTFAGQGGPYVWVRLAFGKLAAAIATMLYWITNPLWMGGSIVFIAAATWGTYISPLPAGSVPDYLFKLVFIWLAIATAVVGLRYGKHIVAAGAIAKVGMVAVFVLTVVVYAFKHGIHGYAAGQFAPTLGGFLAVTPIVLFAVVGFDAPSGAAEEMHNARRDIPRAIASSGVASALCYLLPIFAIPAVLPAREVRGASGLLDAFRQVFTVWGLASGPVMFVAGLLFVFVLLTQASAWMIASDRVEAAAGTDGAFIKYFGAFSKRLGTPVRMNMLSGVIASIFCVAATALLKGSTADVFTVVLSVAVSTLLLSYLLIFPTPIVLRRKYADVDRPFAIPGGRIGLWGCTGLIWLWVLLGSWVTVFPGTLEPMLGIHYDFASTWGVDRMTFELFTLGTLAAIVILALIGYAVGSRDAARTTTTRSALGAESTPD